MLFNLCFLFSDQAVSEFDLLIKFPNPDRFLPLAYIVYGSRICYLLVIFFLVASYTLLVLF